jgi:hypothetical protein
MDYGNCINKDVVDDPNAWATTILTVSPVFAVWSEENKMLVAAEAASKVQSECHASCPNDGTCSGLCDGCKIGL